MDWEARLRELCLRAVQSQTVNSGWINDDKQVIIKPILGGAHITIEKWLDDPYGYYDLGKDVYQIAEDGTVLTCIRHGRRDQVIEGEYRIRDYVEAVKPDCAALLQALTRFYATPASRLNSAAE